MKPPKVAILGMPAGQGNLGDEALVASVIQNLRLRVPGVEILALTANPEDTVVRHGVPALCVRASRPRLPAVAPTAERAPEAAPSSTRHPWVRAILTRAPRAAAAARGVRSALLGLASFVREIGFLALSLVRLRGTRLLVIPGSGVLSDHFGGPMRHPYTLWKWCALARLNGARIVFLSMGAGPLDSRLSRWFVKRSLNWADYRSLRDATSKQVVDALGVQGPTPVYPDLVYSIRLPVPASRAVAAPSREIGINPFPHFDPRYWPVSDRDSYRAYVDRLATFCAELLRRGYRLHLFPTQFRSDPPVIEDLRGEIVRQAPGTEERIVVPSVRTLEELAAVLDRVDVVVATRFHGILLALMRARPVLAISNHHKMTELMSAVDLAEYVVHIDQLDPATLIERFLALEADRVRTRAQVEPRIAEFGETLAAQYELAFRELREART